MAQPSFHTLALADMPRPDYLDMIAVPLPPGASHDPQYWADAVFSVENSPGWVRAAFIVRNLLAPLVGIPRGEMNIFAVNRVEGEEALISVDDRHLDFRAAVGVDPKVRIVRVTTAVRLKGWRGRLYFAPVRVVHPVVVTAMMRKAARRARNPRA